MELPNDHNFEVLLSLRGKREGNTVRIDAKCAALVGGACSIHTTRPDACRRYEVGSPQCIASITSQRLSHKRRLIELAIQHREGGLPHER